VKANYSNALTIKITSYCVSASSYWYCSVGIVPVNSDSCIPCRDEMGIQKGHAFSSANDGIFGLSRKGERLSPKSSKGKLYLSLLFEKSFSFETCVIFCNFSCRVINWRFSGLVIFTQIWDLHNFEKYENSWKMTLRLSWLSYSRFQYDLSLSHLGCFAMTHRVIGITPTTLIQEKKWIENCSLFAP
jgi:hypothetical protein